MGQAEDLEQLANISEGRQDDTDSRGQSMSNTCGLPCPIIRVERKDEKVEAWTGKMEVPLTDIERKLSWLQIKLEELIPGYTDGVTQEVSREEEDGLPKDNHEKRNTTAAQAAKGQQDTPLPENSGESFQNHALKNMHTPTRARQGWSTRVSRLAGRGGFRRLVRQGGSSNPKGGANRKRRCHRGVSGRRGLERPPIEETRFKVYPDKVS
jgi:hypothetical protein